MKKQALFIALMLMLAILLCACTEKNDHRPTDSQPEIGYPNSADSGASSSSEQTVPADNNAVPPISSSTIPSADTSPDTHTDSISQTPAQNDANPSADPSSDVSVDTPEDPPVNPPATQDEDGSFSFDFNDLIGN